MSITPAFAGIAETGTLLLRSGQDGPTTLNFLPDTHIVLLPAGADCRQLRRRLGFTAGGGRSHAAHRQLHYYPAQRRY